MKKTYLISGFVLFICICICALLIIVFASLGIFVMNSNTSEVTDITQYETILSSISSQDSQLVKFFPQQIPSNSKDVTFSYLPQYLQGGEHIQLRLGQSEIEIQQILSKYRNEALASYQGGDTNDHANKGSFIPTTFYYTSGSDNQSFPKEYEILVLYSNPQSPENGESKWNHGETSGIAVNQIENVVVYWAESW